MLNDIEFFWENKKQPEQMQMLDLLIKELQAYKEKDVTEYLEKELSQGIYTLSQSEVLEDGKYYIALVPQESDYKRSPVVSDLPKDKFVFRIALNYDKEAYDEKGNSKYGTVESIEFGQMKGEKDKLYSPEDALEILESPRCLTYKQLSNIYSAIILKNFNYFNKQQEKENLNFLFPSPLEEFESTQYITDSLASGKKKRTIFIPFSMDYHVVLARLNEDDKQIKNIGFVDSSYFFNIYIHNGHLSNTCPHKQLSDFLGNMDKNNYFLYAINPSQFKPQQDLSSISYDNGEKCQDRFLSGTCSFCTIGAATKIVQSLLDKNTKEKLVTCNPQEMVKLYTPLYQASLEYTKTALEKCLIPVHNSSKKQLEQIFNNFPLELSSNYDYLYNIFSDEKGLKKIEKSIDIFGSNLIVSGMFINDKNNILLIDPPEISDDSRIHNTTIAGRIKITDHTFIDGSVIFGYGNIKDSEIYGTKIFCSHIHEAILRNSQIRSSLIKNSSVEKDSIINNSTITKDSTISDSTVEKESTVSSSTIEEKSEISNSTITKYSHIIHSTISDSTVNDHSKITGSTISNSTVKGASQIINSSLSGVTTYGKLKVQEITISNKSNECSCCILGDDSVNLSGIKLNVDESIKDDIIITTEDFFDKISDNFSWFNSSYRKYLEFLSNYINDDVKNLKKIKCDNGMVILSKNKNLAFEMDQNGAITVKNNSNNLSDNQSIDNSNNKHKNALTDVSTNTTINSIHQDNNIHDMMSALFANELPTYLQGTKMQNADKGKKEEKKKEAIKKSKITSIITR